MNNNNAKIFFEKLIASVKEDFYYPQNNNKLTLEQHLENTNNISLFKYSLNELKQIEKNLTYAIKDFTHNTGTLNCSSLITLYNCYENPEIFMYYIL